jgi:hypothetical protein
MWRKMLMATIHANGKKSDRALFVLMIVFPIAGVIVLYFGFQALKNGYQSRAWPAAQGRITQSQAALEHVKRSGSTGSTIRYAARIRYNYTVGAKTYSSSTIGFGKSRYTSKKQSKTMKYLEQYPEGKSVTVYYAPDDPRRAALETGITGGAFLILLIGFVFLIAGGACFIGFRKQRAHLLNHHF